MAKKGKQYRDRYGRFAKRGQPTKPVQPRIQGRYVSRPAPLRLGINKAGKRYWIQPRPKRSQGIIGGGGRGSRGIKEGPTREKPRETITESQKNDLRNAPSVYGYKLEDFLGRTSYPEGYSYITYHIFLMASYKGQANRIITVRGRQYNTPEDLEDGVQEELEEIGEDEGEGMGGEYLYTVVAVTPVKGELRTPGSVYPEDYHPKERPGTREFEIEQGKAKARRFWETGKLES